MTKAQKVQLAFTDSMNNRTPFLENLAKHGLAMEDAVAEHLAEKHPSPKFVAAEEVAAFVVFLCGAAAAGINGAVLPIDRGWLAR